jgi:hypothetical protein
MKCKKVKELILDYSEDDLDQSDKLEVEKHLTICNECNVYYEQSYKVWNMLDKWDAVDVKDNFISKFWDKVSTQDSKTISIFHFLRYSRVNLIGGLVGVVVLILGVFFANTFVSHRYNIVFTEEDKFDEELLIEFDKAVSKETVELLDVYGPWDEKIEENKGG